MQDKKENGFLRKGRGYVRTRSLAGNLVNGFCKAFDIAGSDACDGNPSILGGIYRVLRYRLLVGNYLGSMMITNLFCKYVHLGRGQTCVRKHANLKQSARKGVASSNQAYLGGDVAPVVPTT